MRLEKKDTIHLEIKMNRPRWFVVPCAKKSNWIDSQTKYETQKLKKKRKKNENRSIGFNWTQLCYTIWMIIPVVIIVESIPLKHMQLAHAIFIFIASPSIHRNSTVQSTLYTDIKTRCAKETSRYAMHSLRTWFLSVSTFVDTVASEREKMNGAISYMCIRMNEMKSIDTQLLSFLAVFSPVFFAWHSTPTISLLPFCTHRDICYRFNISQHCYDVVTQYLVLMTVMMFIFSFKRRFKLVGKATRKHDK